MVTANLLERPPAAGFDKGSYLVGEVCQEWQEVESHLQAIASRDLKVLGERNPANNHVSLFPDLDPR